MGQQQLLMLAIGIVIVAIAVMTGIFAFYRNMKQGDADMLVNRNLELANAAVFWKTKKDPFAGGNASYSGLGTNPFGKLFMDATTHMGTFQIKSPTSSTLTITGVSNRYPEIGARTFVTNYRIDSSRVDFGGSIELE